MAFHISAESIADGRFFFCADDARHISLVLRMKPPQELLVCDDASQRHLCRLISVERDHVCAEIISSEHYSNRPSAEVTVYAALSKGDRFDYLIQKCVECGACAIVPFVSERCIARPGKSQYKKKRLRFQKIADEAARQSERTDRVSVSEILSCRAAFESAASHKTPVFLYENENRFSLSSLLRAANSTDFALISGPEGGFSQSEAELASALNIPSVSIGPRILRCETAPVAALCSVMYHTGNFDIGE